MSMARAERASAGPMQPVQADTPAVQPLHREIREDLYDAVSILVPGTIEGVHEEDIRFVADIASSEFGITEIDAFSSWLSHQELMARRSHAWEDPGGRFSVPPNIVQIAAYLRGRQKDLARFQT